MNKYPLIKLFSDTFGGTKRTDRPAPRKPVKQTEEAAKHAIMQAKLKRVRRKAKRAANLQKQG